MPRHRPVGRPRHRAKRQGLWPARGVRWDAATHRAATALAPPVELISASGQARAKGPRMRPDFGRMVRGAMLTPWFAFSAGIVIAASLTLATPHPALTFPPGQSGRCIQVGCASPPRAPSGQAPAIKHVVRLSPPHGRVRVEYQLLHRNHDRFVAVILIVGHRSLGNWRLRFVMPGVMIDDIWGATTWRPDGHGVIVSGSPSPWQKSGDNEARIIVFGTGRLARPRGCQFDNRRCAFRALPRNARQEPGSRWSWHHQWADRSFGD